MNRPILLMAAALALASSLAADVGWAAEAGKEKCPPLGGAWSGSFDGSASGSWIAEFRVSGDQMSASARILVLNAGAVEGHGSAKISCRDGVASLTGEGEAHGRKGTFTGVLHKDGRYIVGGWDAGSLSGTWNGERAKRPPAPGVLPQPK